MSILFLQRSASEAYELTSTLKANLIPEETTMKGSAEVRSWIADVVTTTWQDARCGDGRCEAPFEYPEYGRFGCKADCNLLKSAAQITPIQIDVYFNFSHPKGSVSPIDLMNDAAWNLCPMEVDELIGPKKIFHGSDCYYEEDQKFDEQVGHIVREIDDVPDGDWSIVVKKDIFLKVAGAVRPRLNVTVEAKNKRLLLASHYGQIRRKHEVATYEWVKSELERTNHSIALFQLWDSNRLLNDSLIEKNGTVENYFENGWWAGNQTLLEEDYLLNQTMVNNSFDAGSGVVAAKVQVTGPFDEYIQAYLGESTRLLPWDAASKKFHLVDTPLGTNGSKLVLYSIDPTDGSSTSKDVVDEGNACGAGFPQGLAFDDQTAKLIIATQTPTTATFCAVDPADGKAASVGSVARGASEDSDSYYAACERASSHAPFEPPALGAPLAPIYSRLNAVCARSHW